MQPMISPIDHESRNNSYRAEDEQRPTEETPLLVRFPPSPYEDRSHVSLFTVSVLLLILVSGVAIGIYLLIIQGNAENILPPVDMPLLYVSRKQWDKRPKPAVLWMSPLFKARQVVVVQTDTRQCLEFLSCVELLEEMQANDTSPLQSLPYNFLLSSSGQLFEGLGWRRSSPLFPQYSTSALVLAFIGNFTEVPPTKAQLKEAELFFAESMSLQHLEPSFVIIGKRSKEAPEYLFQSLSQLPQWDSNLSDS